MEKRVKFTHDGKDYIFSSSVPDEVNPPENKIVRAYTVFQMQEFYRREDGKV